MGLGPRSLSPSLESSRCPYRVNPGLHALPSFPWTQPGAQPVQRCQCRLAH